MSDKILAHTLYGKPAVSARLAHIDGARIAAPSAEYVGRGNKCSANEDTCEGIRAKGTSLCYGHIKAEAAKNKQFLAGTESKVVTDAAGEDDAH